MLQEALWEGSTVNPRRLQPPTTKMCLLRKPPASRAGRRKILQLFLLHSWQHFAKLKTIMPIVYVAEAWISLTSKRWPAPGIWTPEFWVSFLGEAAEDTLSATQLCGICLCIHLRGMWQDSRGVISKSQNIVFQCSKLNMPLHMQRPLIHAPNNIFIMQWIKQWSSGFPAVHLKKNIKMHMLDY